MTREKLICEILLFWTKDQDRADRIDEKSYTHASCGYEEAQSYVKGLLGYSVESLEYLLKEYQEGAS